MLRLDAVAGRPAAQAPSEPGRTCIHSPELALLIAVAAAGAVAAICRAI